MLVLVMKTELRIVTYLKKLLSERNQLTFYIINVLVILKYVYFKNVLYKHNILLIDTRFGFDIKEPWFRRNGGV